MRALMLSLLLVVSPAYAADCGYVAESGNVASFTREPGYLVIAEKGGDLYCQSDPTPVVGGSIAECPDQEYEYVLSPNQSELKFQGVTYTRDPKCEL